MNDTKNSFQMWCLDRGFDQERWTPGLLRALKRRYERSMQRLVIDGECRWPQRVHRVNQNENTPSN